MCLAQQEYALNHLDIQAQSDSTGTFSFFVAGHTYGSLNQSVFPAASILAHVDKLNADSASFLMLLGDSYKKADSIHILNFKRCFIDKLKIPAFNALGNHEGYTSKGIDFQLYHDVFGVKPYFYFEHQNNLFVVLDSEQSIVQKDKASDFSENQTAFLHALMHPKIKDQQFQNAFFFVHRPLHLKQQALFFEQLKPLLRVLNEQNISVYTFSGDMAAQTTDLYAVKDTIFNLTYVHTHITDGPDDKMLKVQVSHDGSVQLLPISLTFQTPLSINQYTEVMSAENTSSSIIQKIKRRLFDRSFLQGAFFAFILCLTVYTCSKFFVK